VEALLRLPVLERLSRRHQHAIQLVNQFAVYNCRNQLELLAGTGIRCPPITSYLDRLMDYVKAHFAAPRPAPLESAAEDPLDVG
jgi:hypothetical protein